MRTRRTVGAAIVLVLAIAGDASVAAPSPELAVDRIPFRLDAGAIVVDVSIGSASALPFLFDSGLSDGNVLSATVARTLHVKTQGDVRYGDASGSGQRAARARLPSIRIGDTELKDQAFAVTDLPTRESADGGVVLAGVLGAPLLDGAVLCIDYRQLRLERWRRSAFVDRGLISMPMRRRHGLPTVQVIVDGLPATVVVDTGYDGGIAVFPAFAESGNLRGRYPELHAEQGTSGSGRRFGILQGTAGEVALSQDTTLATVPLAVVPQAFDPAWGIDGLLGYEVLSRVQPCLDRDGQRLLWKPAS